jgi:hypothetical protein
LLEFTDDPSTATFCAAADSMLVGPLIVVMTWLSLLSVLE